MSLERLGDYLKKKSEPSLNLTKVYQAAKIEQEIKQRYQLRVRVIIRGRDVFINCPSAEVGHFLRSKHFSVNPEQKVHYRVRPEG